MKRMIFAAASLFALLSLASCGGDKKPQGDPDLITVAIDETFKPVMEEEMHQFNLQYPEATFKHYYCSESEALQMLLDDSVRSCLATRQLSDKEKALLQSRSLNVMTERIATDGIALIVNRSNPDTLISRAERYSLCSTTHSRQPCAMWRIQSAAERRSKATFTPKSQTRL